VDLDVGFGGVDGRHTAECDGSQEETLEIHERFSCGGERPDEVTFINSY
jgi:hypothetical protein